MARCTHRKDIHWAVPLNSMDWLVVGLQSMDFHMDSLSKQLVEEHHEVVRSTHQAHDTEGF